MTRSRPKVAGLVLVLVLLAVAAPVWHQLQVPAQAAEGRVAAESRAPICQDDSLNHSALLGDGHVTVSPTPGTLVAPARGQISFLGVPADELANISVVGSRSGPHEGQLLSYSQGDGASFVPTQPFQPGETVTVHAEVLINGSPIPFGWHFTVATSPPLAPASARKAEHVLRAVDSVQHFHSAPGLHPPTVTVTKHQGKPASGYLFMAPEQPPIPSGPMIFNNKGQLVWFGQLPTGDWATDFHAQSYAGQPVLTYWEHVREASGAAVSQDVILNDHYQGVATVRGGNGLATDTHEFQITPAGTALLSVDQPVRCDLSHEGGAADGVVADGVLQEIDIATGLVMYQWSSLDHVSLADSYASPKPLHAGQSFDYFHLNSIALERDGSLLISSRQTWAVYDIDSHTGRVRWRLGGKRSSFKMGAGTSTAYQHAARPLPGSEISIFDNGGSPRVEKHSRGIVVRLSLAHHTATLVRQLRRPAAITSNSQGDVQRLSNGRYVVGWGQIADVSEFSGDGKLLFDAHLPKGEQSYRDFRFPWEGIPTEPPAIAVEPSRKGRIKVWASWNGDTQVRDWEVLEGPPGQLVPVAHRERRGFETAISAVAPASGDQVAVQAVGAHGKVLGTSEPAA